ITDDTQMTLWTAEGLLRADNRFTTRGIVSLPHVVWHSYQRWLATQGERAHSLYGDVQPDPLTAGWLIGEKVLRHRRAPGNTCLSALRSGRIGTTEEPLNG